MPKPDESSRLERVDRPSEAYQKYLSDLSTAGEELRGMIEQADRMAELADRVEGKWRRRNYVILAASMVLCTILGFLLADYFQLRLFSTSPQALIDGKVPTQSEIDLIRGVRKQRAKSEAIANRPKTDKEIDDFAARMELTQQALAIATTEYPEDKVKRLARFRELVGTPTRSPINDLQGIAERIKEATLKEGQDDDSSSSDNGADSR